MCNYVNYLKCFVAYLMFVNQGIFRKGNCAANCKIFCTHAEIRAPIILLNTKHNRIFFGLEKIT